MAFVRRYDHDNVYVADERWREEQENLNTFYNMIALDPFPFLAAFWARMADTCILIVYAGISCFSAQVFAMLDETTSEIMSESSSLSCHRSFHLKLEDIRRQYVLASTLVESIDDCFGFILLFNIAKAFVSCIAEFNNILQTNGLFLKNYLEFIHTTFRFFIILVPSFLVAQQVLATLSQIMLSAFKV